MRLEKLIESGAEKAMEDQLEAFGRLYRQMYQDELL
jgi:hypothetical protein